MESKAFPYGNFSEKFAPANRHPQPAQLADQVCQWRAYSHREQLQVHAAHGSRSIGARGICAGTHLVRQAEVVRATSGARQVKIASSAFFSFGVNPAGSLPAIHRYAN